MYFLEDSKRLKYAMLYNNYFYEYHNQIINIAVSDKVCVFLTK